MHLPPLRPLVALKPTVADSKILIHWWVDHYWRCLSATYFYQNGVAGACGTVHSDSDYIVATDYRRYGDLSKQSDLCGKKVLITNTKNGKTVICTVADACPTCNNGNSLDLSEGAFKEIASLDDGMVPISYTYM
jgi:expansin (peptidoglycan-binding protein)